MTASPTVAILGLGRVGRRIARALRADGSRVRASHRAAPAGLDADADELVALDLEDTGERRTRALEELTRGARLLVWAASRYEPPLLAAARVPVLLLGSTGVYGQDAGETVDETTDPSPRDESGRTLLRAEEAVLGDRGCVLRLAGLYARDRGPQRLLSSAPLSAEGCPRLEPPGERLLNLIHEEDAARAAVFAIERGLTGVWNVSDGQPLARRDFYSLAARCAGLPEPVFDRPGGRGGLGRRVSNAKLIAAGFTLAHPLIRPSFERG